MGMVTYENVVQRLVEQVPESRQAYEEHLNFCGEILPHVLFGELTGFIIRTYRLWAKSGDPCVEDKLQHILNFLEECAQSTDERVVDLVSVSFLENLWQAGSDYEPIKKRLGPNLQKLLLQIEAWEPE